MRDKLNCVGVSLAVLGATANRHAYRRSGQHDEADAKRAGQIMCLTPISPVHEPGVRVVQHY